ncbi:MAG: uroporphyrinogen-III synthase [Holophaga sp.]|nr:uroporphyrinogen-III synthase [Holophaga sp.]
MITRPEHQAAATALHLRALGAVPISLPLIALASPPNPAQVAETVQGLADYDLVALTSANAARFFLETLLGQGHDASHLRANRIAAIGKGTASTLEQAGVYAAIIPVIFVGEALTQAILDYTILQNLLPQRAPPSAYPRPEAPQLAWPICWVRGPFHCCRATPWPTSAPSPRQPWRIVGWLCK